MKMKKRNKKIRDKVGEASVAVCILLIAWNQSGEQKTLPSDQASLTLSLRKTKRRRTASVLHVSKSQLQVTWKKMCYKVHF